MARKKDEVLIHATAWMNFVNRVLNERSQTLSLVGCFYLGEMSREGKTIGTENRLVVSSASEGESGPEGRGVTANG